MLSKTYDAKVLALQKLQTGGKAKRQVIKVIKQVQVNYTDARSVNITPAAKPSERAALPCPDTGGEVVSFAALRGKKRCKLHGGAKGSGAPRGSRNGSFKHGGFTMEAIELRREVAALLKSIREGCNA